MLVAEALKVRAGESPLDFKDEMGHGVELMAGAINRL
jgi:hypothetical protein